MSEVPTRADPVDPETGDELTLLLEEALERHEAGEHDMLDLVERAGPRADELRDQLRLLLDLEVLCDELRDGEPPPQLIETLGRFRNLRPLGAGGYAQVYAAHDPQLGREVALKVLSGRALLADACAWMVAESRALAHIEHPSVVRVYEADEADGAAYVVMELVRGPSLAEVLPLLRPDAGAPPADASPALLRAAHELRPMAARLRLVAQLARALDACHRGGVVHRDVKPANVLISSDGPKLIDFGLSHLEDEQTSLGLTGRLVGTAGYVAPEQVESDEVGADPRGDQFALGVVLYELLTHRHPFLRETRRRTMDAISEAQPTHPRRVAPEVPQDVALVCLHCLERYPDERYPNLAALAGDLEAVLEYRAIGLRPPSPWRRLSLWTSRHRRHVLASSAAVAALGLAWLHFARQERSAMGAQLAALYSTVPRPDSNVEVDVFLRHFAGVIQVRERCQALDDEVVMRVLFGALTPELDKLTKLADTRLTMRLDRERNRAGGAAVTRHALERWGPALIMSDLAMGRPVRGRAAFDERLGLPESGTLYRYDERAHPLTDLRAVPYGERLVEGRYRYVGALGGAPVEVEFSAFWWGAQVRPPRALSAELAARMTELPSSAFSWKKVNTTFRIEVAPFRILTRPVTWGDVRRALGAEALEGLLRADLLAPGRLDALLAQPAQVPVAVAREFATAVGGRLPTVDELFVAYRDGGVEPGTRKYELTALADVDHRNALAVRVQDLQLPEMPTIVPNWEHVIPESSVNPDATFRIAQTRGAGIPTFSPVR